MKEKQWPVPKLCCQCRHSKQKLHHDWNGECWHPVVIMSDAWSLANNKNGQPIGSDCHNERKKRFGKCGRKGKLWECIEHL